MTAPDSLPLHALTEDNRASASPDLLRARVRTFADALMSPPMATRSATPNRGRSAGLTADGLHTFYVRTSGARPHDLLVHNCLNLAPDELKFPDLAHMMKEHDHVGEVEECVDDAGAPLIAASGHCTAAPQVRRLAIVLSPRRSPRPACAGRGEPRKFP